MHSIGGEEAIIDSLTLAIGIDRIAEVAVSVPVVLPQRRGSHADLEGVLKILQNLPPVAFVAGASAMALVHDNKVEEIAGVFPIETGAVRVAGNSLVDGEVHLPALDGFPFDLAPSVAERRENLVFGFVYENIAVGEV